MLKQEISVMESPVSRLTIMSLQKKKKKKAHILVLTKHAINV